MGYDLYLVLPELALTGNALPAYSDDEGGALL